MLVMKRRICVAIVSVAALAWCAGAGDARASASNKATNLRLMSYNVQHCEGPRQKFNVAQVAAAIKREKPDFVGINEVHSKTHRALNVDQPAKLGMLTGLHATFAQAIPYQGGGYGVAVLSRQAPLSVERVPLPGGEPRVLLLCEFRDFWFGTTHLDLGKNQQLESVEIIRGVVAEKSATKPVFLTGDWNNTPKSKTLDAMRGFMTVISKEDCRTFHGRKQYPPESEYCIDYIAVDSAHAESVKVKEAHVTPDLVTSDHNPIAATVSLLPPQQRVARAETASAPVSASLRLATYNIHHGEGKDGRYDLHRILDYVESDRLDIFGFNEVDFKTERVHGADTPAEIAQLTGMHVEYAAARAYKGGSYGNAVVSKEHPLSTLRVDLPRGNGENGLKCSLMLCEFTNYWFGSTHFEIRSALTNQLRSAEIVRKVVEEKARTKPVFLSGDWNNEPGSVTLDKMCEFMTILNDTHTRTYNGFRVKPNDDEYCIDYIAVDNAHAAKYKVSERRAKDWSFASDHNPVFVSVAENQ